jgi:hypothetical protein
MRYVTNSPSCARKMRSWGSCLIINNHDDMLREAKKMSKELRASLDHARNRVAELETQNLDAKLEKDSLKASPVVSDAVDCGVFSIFLVDITALEEKHASKCEELDVPRLSWLS